MHAVFTKPVFIQVHRSRLLIQGSVTAQSTNRNGVLTPGLKKGRDVVLVWKEIEEEKKLGKRNL